MIRDNMEKNKEVKSNTAFLKELKEKLPQFFTADKLDEEGNIVEAGTFDLEKLKNALKENNINELTSGYQLDFIGKNYARKQAGEYSTTVIVPDNVHNQKAENKDSKNLFFTGDNLEVLRHLQNNYENSIDCIYIDPPYNTGSDGFVYPDKFEYSDEQLQAMFNLNENELARLKSIQGKATHSAWLTFMYPRLYLAKKLLKDTGVIFVSIDDNEQANLKLLMDEILGESNFVAKFDWRKKTGANDAKDIAVITESIYLYTKNYEIAFTNKIWGRNEAAIKTSRYNQVDEFTETRGKFYYDTLDRGGLNYSDSMNYPIEAPDGGIIYPNGRSEFENDGWIWKWGKEKVNWGLKNKFLEFVESNKSKGSKYTIKYKVYQNVDNDGNIRERRGQAYSNLILDPINQSGSQDIFSLFKISGLFSNPKPVKLIKYLLNIIDRKDLVVLDFFAGSASTADAVLQLNDKDNGDRQFILVQIPELTRIDSIAYKEGYKSIDKIAYERIKKSISKIIDSGGGYHQQCRYGLRV